MKLLFNLEVVEGKRIRARPSDYLKSLTADEQRAAVTEFLDWAQAEVRDNPDPQARAEAEIGIATAREFLDRSQPRIYTGADEGTADE
ncbi:MAG: hypothetical protein KJO66_00730 [Gammaproteobacteria bacterium]|nr:hypothetical protein [Gammaproteobacteria bacterium]